MGNCWSDSRKQQYERTILQLQTNNRNYEKQIESYKTELLNVKTQHKTIQSKLKDIQNKLKISEGRYQWLEQQRKRDKDQYQQKLTRTRVINDRENDTRTWQIIERLETQKKQSTNKMISMGEQSKIMKRQFQLKIVQLEDERSKMLFELRQSNNLIIKLKQIKNNSMDEVQAQKVLASLKIKGEAIQKYEKEINSLKNQIEVLTNNLRELTKREQNQFDNLKSIISGLERQNIKLKNANTELLCRLEKIQLKNTNLQNEKVNLQSENTNLKKQNVFLTNDNKRLMGMGQLEKMKQATIAEVSRNYDCYFPGNMLDDQQDYKAFVIGIIEKKTRRKIVKTKFICKFDPLNKTNFHAYIDGKPNLVIIIKTASGYLLGGWTESPFSSSKSSGKAGMIFSITNRKFYDLVDQNKRAISYDDYYLIFGNSQIRLKSLQKKIFSNFGIANSYYNNKGDKVDKLLGSSDREIEIDGYEIFELIFD